MPAVAALLCCCGGSVECGDLPTAVNVAWNGSAEILYSACETCESGNVYLLGYGVAPTSCSAVAYLFDCLYFGENSCEVENSIEAVVCQDSSSAGSVNFTVRATVSQPVANISGPNAGYWTVGVELAFVSISSGSELVDLWECTDGSNTCGLWGGTSIVFVGPPTSSLPLGSYLPSGSTWFDCVLASGASIVSDVPGSVTVS